MPTPRTESIPTEYLQPKEGEEFTHSEVIDGSVVVTIDATSVPKTDLALDQNLLTQLYNLREITSADLFDEAETLSDRLTYAHGIRTLDLLHLAAAVRISASDFFTANQRQHDAAQHLGIVLMFYWPAPSRITCVGRNRMMSKLDHAPLNAMGDVLK